MSEESGVRRSEPPQPGCLLCHAVCLVLQSAVMQMALQRHGGEGTARVQLTRKSMACSFLL